MDAFRTFVFLASVRRSVGARECDALCSSLLFDWSEAPGPGAYDFEKTVEGVAPFSVREGCDELVQECLFLDDVTMMNARIGADGDAFPTYPNPGHPSHPSLAEVLFHSATVPATVILTTTTGTIVPRANLGHE